MTKTCLNCKKEYEGRDGTKFCSTKCRVASNRIGVTVGVTESGVSVTKNPKNAVSVTRRWIPNWERVGHKTKEEAEAHLMWMIGNELPAGRYMFKGIAINTDK